MPNRFMTTRSWRPFAWCAVGLLTVCVLLALLYRLYHPSDRYRFVVKNVPPDVEYLSIVALIDGRVENLDYYLPAMGRPPTTMQPQTFNGSFRSADSPRDAEGYIAFRQASKYGVIVKKVTGQWEIVWIKAPTAALTRCMGKRLELDFNAGTVEVPDQSLLTSLKMNEADEIIGSMHEQ